KPPQLFHPNRSRLLIPLHRKRRKRFRDVQLIIRVLRRQRCDMIKQLIRFWTLGIVVYISPASAAIGVTGGILHAEASGGPGFTSFPPDKPFVPPTTSVNADTQDSGTPYAHNTASFVNGQVGISVRTYYLGNPV